jgi:hypothetical protein
MDQTVVKKVYSEPQLVVHGTIEEITLGDKTYGPTDGFTFQGAPIMNAS